MTDVFDLDLMLGVEVLLKRKDDEHSIDVAANRVEAVAAPRPHLRADVVDDFESITAQAARQAEIEIGPVDEDHGLRPSLPRCLKQVAVGPVKPSERSN